MGWWQFFGCAIAAFGVALSAQSDTTLREKDSVQVPAFHLPPSAFLSEETLARLRQTGEQRAAEWNNNPCPAIKGADFADLPAIRQCQAQFFYTTSLYKDMRTRFDVNIETVTIGGVYTEIFTPVDGVPEANADRVLINVHGGGFTGGSRTSSRLESIPIAALGKIKVVSVDYRLAPEYKFPAASEDVATVYKALLKDYTPKNIGIYGCSAGGRITGQTVAELLKENIPLPGAVGILCSPPTRLDGDSNHIVFALQGRTPMSIFDVPYFEGVAPDDPMAFPGEHPEVLKRFPPSLLLVSTRDYSLSPMVHMHSLLVREGVPANLHVWDGLGHAFLYDPELAESREAYDVIIDFFDKHLGR